MYFKDTWVLAGAAEQRRDRAAQALAREAVADSPEFGEAAQEAGWCGPGLGGVGRCVGGRGLQRFPSAPRGWVIQPFPFAPSSRVTILYPKALR